MTVAEPSPPKAPTATGSSRWNPGATNTSPKPTGMVRPQPAVLDVDVAEPRVRDDLRRHARGARVRDDVLAGGRGHRIGTGLGAVAHYFLSARGPLHGVPQMVLARSAFGFKGNAVPAVLMCDHRRSRLVRHQQRQRCVRVVHAVRIRAAGRLVIIVLAQTALAFFGHNLVQAFERYSFPVLAVIFIAASVAIFAHADLGKRRTRVRRSRRLGGFLLTVGTSFGYAAGWTPYAADFTRYLPKTCRRHAPDSSPRQGLFTACWCSRWWVRRR